MITLCKKNSRIVYCSNSQSENDRCSICQCTRDMNRFVYFFFNFSNSWLSMLDWLIVLRFYRINIVDKWKHIYRCHKNNFERKHDFIKFCFQCNKWIIAAIEWFKHCQRHFNNFDTFLIQYNSFIFHRILVIIEQCLFCFFDLKLSSTKRFHQFLIK